MRPDRPPNSYVAGQTAFRWSRPHYLVLNGAHLGTHHVDRFPLPDGLSDKWVNALAHLRGHPAYTPVERRRLRSVPVAPRDALTGDRGGGPDSRGGVRGGGGDIESSIDVPLR